MTTFIQTDDSAPICDVADHLRALIDVRAASTIGALSLKLRIMSHHAIVNSLSADIQIFGSVTPRWA